MLGWKPTPESSQSPGMVADDSLPLHLVQHLGFDLSIRLSGRQHVVDGFHQRVGYSYQRALVSDLGL